MTDPNNFSVKYLLFKTKENINYSAVFLFGYVRSFKLFRKGS